MRRAAITCIALLVWSSTGRSAPEPAKSPVLVALEEGISRSMKILNEKADPPPYFLSYRVTENEDSVLSMSQGAIRQKASNRSRILDVDIRVGSNEVDSTRRLRDTRGTELDRSRPVFIPIEDDPDALRAALWLETDGRYRAAAERLPQVRADLAVKAAAEDASADFSREKPETLLAPSPKAEAIPAAWEGHLRTLSTLLASGPEVLESEAALTISTARKYFESSEGTAVQHGSVTWRLTLYAMTRSEDGMDLFRFESFTTTSLAGLPDETTLRSKVQTLIADLAALRVAPVLEPFTGPAILTGRAAGVFFHEIFGHRIEGHRQKDEGEGQTFTKMLNQRVLPEFLSVYDDPTLATAGGVDLSGTYLADDEGIHARRVTVVEKGVLKNFLMSRTPIAGFATSNGHGRAQPGRRPVGRQGNLIVEASAVVSEARLREMLLEECKRQGKPFGLLFADISGGFTFTGRFLPQAFKVSPVMVYRVFVDGRPDELVRGADLIGTPLISFSKILAAGSERAVFNGSCGAESGWIPVSASSPSLLTAQIEVQKKEKSSSRPPLLPNPRKETRP